jgi:hypothetical protein
MKARRQVLYQPALIPVRETVPCLECGERLQNLGDLRAPSCKGGVGHRVEPAEYFKLYGLTAPADRAKLTGN